MYILFKNNAVEINKLLGYIVTYNYLEELQF